MITVFRHATGLNVKVAKSRVKYDPQTGVNDLTLAYNVEIDKSGQVSRRHGFAPTVRTEVCHSLFCDGGDCLFVSGDSLYKLNPDYSRIGLRSGMTLNARLDCVQVVNRIYYVNGYELGYVEGDHSYVWSIPTQLATRPTFRQFSNPPTGHLVEHHNGRMYVAKDNVLWHSEPFAYNLFDYARNYIWFESKIQMVKSVFAGIFVSDMKRTYFLQGLHPTEFMRKVVCTYPAIMGTAVKIDGSYIGEGYPERAVIWASDNGICLGLPDGGFKNLSVSKIEYPNSNLGSAVAFEDKYICLLQ
jgi:hypothetical protein